MKSFICVLVLISLLQADVSWGIECYDCLAVPGLTGKTDCGASGFGPTVTCLPAELSCQIVYSEGKAVARSCSEVCTNTYDPTAYNGFPAGIYCCNENKCNGLATAPLSGVSCYTCDSTAGCDDSAGEYGVEEACFQGKNVCKAYFVNDKAFKRECAASCEAESLYTHDGQGRNGVHCCDTSLCNGPGGPQESAASGVRATLALIFAAFVLAATAGW